MSISLKLLAIISIGTLLTATQIHPSSATLFFQGIARQMARSQVMSILRYYPDLLVDIIQQQLSVQQQILLQQQQQQHSLVSQHGPNTNYQLQPGGSGGASYSVAAVRPNMNGRQTTRARGGASNTPNGQPAATVSQQLDLLDQAIDDVQVINGTAITTS